jgi:hypothetical protein
MEGPGPRSAASSATPDGRLSAAVAELEMEEFERVARVVPVFLWLWEHRDEVRRLLAQGVSWHALAAALGRLGLVDLAGGPPRHEYCRAAWARVVAFEGLVPRGRPERQAAEPPADPFGTVVPSEEPAAPPPAPEPPGASPYSLNTILARGRRTALTEPRPLDPPGRASPDVATEGQP